VPARNRTVVHAFSVAPVNGRVAPGSSACGRGEATKFGSFSTPEHSWWKSDVSEAEIGGMRTTRYATGGC
jgi:hypothetical protein